MTLKVSLGTHTAGCVLEVVECCDMGYHARAPRTSRRKTLILACEATDWLANNIKDVALTIEGIRGGVRHLSYGLAIPCVILT